MACLAMPDLKLYEWSQLTVGTYHWWNQINWSTVEWIVLDVDSQLSQ
jgi:hypothetical protein